jgi:hypothetical protein
MFIGEVKSMTKNLEKRQAATEVDINSNIKTMQSKLYKKIEPAQIKLNLMIQELKKNASFL